MPGGQIQRNLIIWMFRKGDFDIPTAMGTYRSVVNAFPLMSNKGVYEHQRAVTSDKRVYLLTRCAFAGQQRYAANTGREMLCVIGKHSVSRFPQV